MLKSWFTILAFALAANTVAAPPMPSNPMSGKSVADLTEVLNSDAGEMERAYAALALGEMVTPPTEPKGKKRSKEQAKWELKIPEGFMAACALGLRDRASAVRFYAGQALTKAGTDSLPSLIEAAESGNQDTKISSIHAMGLLAKSKAGKKGSESVDLTPGFAVVVPVLRQSLKHDDYIVREVTCATFAQLGVAGAPAVDDLIALLEDDHFCVVNQAVHAVASVDPGGTKSVPALVKALQSQHDVREFIVKELGGMGQHAKAAVPMLCELVGEDKNSWHVALESTKALLKIVTYEERPAQDEVIAERRQALRAIGNALMNQEAEFLRARIRNTFLEHGGYCPIDAECEPLVTAFEGMLREFARTERGYYGPPLPKVVTFLANVGEDYKREELVALAKELKSASDTKQEWLGEFDPLLKLDGK